MVVFYPVPVPFFILCKRLLVRSWMHWTVPVLILMSLFLCSANHILSFIPDRSLLLHHRYTYSFKEFDSIPYLSSYLAKMGNPSYYLCFKSNFAILFELILLEQRNKNRGLESELWHYKTNVHVRRSNNE